MAYCIKCGVELKDSEKKCPLCQTVVYHPEVKQLMNVKPPFPKEVEIYHQKMKNKFKIFIATIIIFLSAFLTMICDYSINSRIIWSNIVLSSICLIYCFIFIPMIIHKKNVFLYLIIDFILLLLFQWYIAYTTGGTWFTGFSLPVTSSVMFIVTIVILIRRYTKVSYLLIFAVIFIFSGLDCVLIEFLINKIFMNQIHLIWSYYPLVTFITIGIILFLSNTNKRLKVKIAKKFFL